MADSLPECHLLCGKGAWVPLLGLAPGGSQALWLSEHPGTSTLGALQEACVSVDSPHPRLEELF